MDSTTTAAETIERVLYLTPTVHVYAIPPLTSTKGHNASSWTKPPSRQIFTARLRILESSSPSSTQKPTSAQEKSSTLTTTILLEDPATNELFAAAPYNSSSVVEAAVDSSRFFAVRVQGEGGRRAVLGIGFEERSDAFDFGVALQEVRKVLGMTDTVPGTPGRKVEAVKVERKKDWGLKEGEMLHVDIGGRGVRRRDGGLETEEKSLGNSERGGGAGKGWIEPPSGEIGGSFGLLPPPPPPTSSKGERRRSVEVSAKKLEELGFDDGEFGEFQ